ncbi:MAG: GGDEF domain-containing protein [Clostridia bacterium]|nr:GGDEF domain-containing protein [Clostridia bacterium]NCC43949.1 GGDEF domain-containing protein [Clostridia bacterium]
MNIVAHLNIHLFPSILLFIICISTHRERIRTTMDRLFQNVLWCTFFILLTDMFCWILDGIVFPGSYVLAWILNICYLIMSPLISALWLNYICFYLRQISFKNLISRKKAVIISLASLYSLLVLISPLTGWVCSIDDHNRYQRGPLYFIPYIVTYIFLVSALVLSIYHGHKEVLKSRKRESYTLACLISLPVIGEFLQLMIYDLWLALPLTAISALLFYLNMQNHQITIDSLTGLNNRGYLDRYLTERNLQNEIPDGLYLFMLDLDHFKHINDTYGHPTGDHALIQAADILKEMFGKTNAILARYGGDEFSIIKQCRNDREALHLIDSLNKAFEAFNQEGTYPYTLSISSGFSRYDSSCEHHLEKLIENADRMMYEQKKARKKS